MYKLVQLFALGLAASTAANGLQIPAAGNVGLTRRVAGQALMVFAVPVLAMPLDNLGLAIKRNETSADEDGEGEAQDEGDEDEEVEDGDDDDDDADDAEDDKDDEADDQDDDSDDAADDKDDSADDAADKKDEE